MLRPIQVSPIAWLLAAACAALPAVADTADATGSGLRELAFAAAREAVAAPDRFEPVDLRVAGEVPPDGAAFELLELDGPNQSGVVRMTFAVRPADGDPVRSVFATVRGDVVGPALVAARTLARGEPLAASAVELRDVELTRLRDEPVRDAARLADRVPVRTLGAGRILTEDLLEPMLVVRRNQPVTLEFVRPGMSVTATGTALADGAPGDAITAVNTSTGARILCEVQSDGSLHVIRLLGRGR